jgi:SAM-dependent methyltransferase
LSFVAWNAERLNISRDECLSRYKDSLAAFPDGHAGRQYRAFNDKSYQVFRVFFDDTPMEIHAAYQFHAHMHFLRMLSYPDPEIHDSDFPSFLSKRSDVSILDFGCGLAQFSRALAKLLRNRGIEVTLTLADIPTIRKEFLVWLLKDEGIQFQFLDCTPEQPIPALPASDVCFATEFFEHVHAPMAFLDAFDGSLRHGGLLVTNLGMHKAEFMHVHPNLDGLRQELAKRGYAEVKDLKIYRKH